MWQKSTPSDLTALAHRQLEAVNRRDQSLSTGGASTLRFETPRRTLCRPRSGAVKAAHAAKSHGCAICLRATKQTGKSRVWWVYP